MHTLKQAPMHTSKHTIIYYITHSTIHTTKHMVKGYINIDKNKQLIRLYDIAYNRAYTYKHTSINIYETIY